MKTVVVRQQVKAEIFTVQAKPVIKYRLEVFAFKYTVVAPEFRPIWRHLRPASAQNKVCSGSEKWDPLRSGTQASTALGSAGINYSPSTTGAHAFTEAVASFAFQYARLESALHNEVPGSFKGLRNLPCLAPNFKPDKAAEYGSTNKQGWFSADSSRG